MEDRDPYGGCRRIQREPVFMLALKWLISFNSWQQLRNYSCFSCSCPAAVKLLPAVGVASCSFPVQMSSASSYTAMERAEGHFFFLKMKGRCVQNSCICVWARREAMKRPRSSNRFLTSPLLLVSEALLQSWVSVGDPSQTIRSPSWLGLLTQV